MCAALVISDCQCNFTGDRELMVPSESRLSRSAPTLLPTDSVYSVCLSV